MERTVQILEFLRVVDDFKAIYRAAYLTDHSRHESDAEHVWHMCLFALLLYQDLEHPVEIARVLALILAHDLVELYAGDTYAHDSIGKRDKREREHAAAERLFVLLPPDLEASFHAWWREYEAGLTEEARFASALDRLQALAQNVHGQGRLWRERGVTERMSRAYNDDAMALDPLLRQAFDVLYTPGG